MKGIILTAIILATAGANASKARLSALQGANHIVDAQTVLTNPQHINLLDQQITFEMGAAGSQAEGGAIFKLSNGNKLGMYVGHDNTTVLRDGATYIKQRNPVEVTYGMGNMAFAGSLSTTDDKKGGKKETTLIGKFGMDLDDSLSLWSHLAVLSQAKDSGTDQEMNEGPGIVIGASKTIDDNRYFGKIGYSMAKETVVGADTDIKGMGVSVGWLNRSFKTDATDIYYGAQVTFNQTDYDGKKVTSSELPLFLGLEHTVTSWSVFRASVKQNFIFGSTKDETATNTDAESVGSNTTVAAGLGLKYGQLTLDGSLAAASNGNINGNAFLTQAGVTYNF